MTCVFLPFWQRWGAFRSSALARQSEIDSVLMRLQGDELERIKEWMTGTEDKISRLGRIGSGPREVEAHLREHEDIQREFEEREVI